jgi:eukaryotic-like serine/threonine-protein kinase
MTISPATDLLLGARYRLVSRIAAGGMGEVWSATDEVLGRNVAVKILRREFADDPTFRQRFRAEARHTAALSHAGIAAVYDYHDGSAADGVAATSPFLVMENVPGEPLSALMARTGALPYDRTLDVIGQTALALQAAHDAGVIHRDIKPGNMLLTPSGNVKITDFGISRAVNSAPLTATGDIMGTAFYLSPEQASGQSVTPASDVYSLGVVAYECLTGHRPFAGDTPVGVALAHVRDEPAALGTDVPPAVAALVMRMLAKNPDDRPASAAEIAREALGLREGLVPPLAATSILAATDVSAGFGAAGDVTVALPGLTRSLGGQGSGTDPGFQLPVARRPPRWLPYAVGLVACALVALFVLHSFANDAGVTTAATAKPKTPSTAPATVLVRAADYVGKPVADAAAELRALNLTVALQPVPAAPGASIGSVTGVTPTGRLTTGATVTLQVAQAPTGRRGRGGPGGSGGGQGKDGNNSPGQQKKDNGKQGKQ